MADPRLASSIRAGEALLPGSEKPGPEKHQTAREWLINIALRPELFHDERSDAYGAITEDGVRRILRVRSKAFRAWLAGQYFDESGKGASAEYVASALTVAEARASRGPRRDLEVRFARRGEQVWIDLCDDRWRAIRITSEGWEVVQSLDAPFLFRRHPHQAPLPVPERGGKAGDVLDFLNVRDTDTGLLLLAWLVIAPIMNVPRPILLFHGPQGSAKSNAAKILRSIIDPSEIPTLDLGRDPGELALTLDHHAVPLFDNVSKVSKWQEDRLCCAVTGGGFSKRMLFTDAEDVILKFRRAVVLTGINIPTNAPDLLDRILLAGLDRIPEGERREEEKLLARVEAARASIFGGLLDVLAATLRIRPTITLNRLPRMADFARWGAAASEALGFGQEAFLTAYRKNIREATGEALEASALGGPVIAFAEAEGDWTGTATRLYDLLTERNPVEAKGPDWPKDAPRFSRALRVLQSSLADVGVSVEFEKKGGRGQRPITIRKTPPSPPYRHPDSQPTDGAWGYAEYQHGSRHGSSYGSTAAVPPSPLPSSGHPVSDKHSDTYARRAADPAATAVISLSPISPGGGADADEELLPFGEDIP